MAPGGIDKLARFSRRRLFSASARIVLSELDARGISSRRAMGGAGIRRRDLDAPEGAILGSQQLALERAFVSETKSDPEIWLDLGFRYRLLAYGPFGLAILNARTVERAVSFMIGYQELAFTVVDYSLVRDRRGEIVGVAGDPASVPEELREFMLTRDVAAIRQLLDDTVNGRFPIARIETPVPRSADPIEYGRRLGAPVRSRANGTKLLFAPGWRKLGMPYGNPILEETYERQCRELFEALDQPSSEIEQVVDLLVRCRGDWPTLEDVAEKMGTSSRTLRRQLARQGTRFRVLLESVRRKQAEELLRMTRLTVAQIADSLGYAEAASFAHAFRRWTGTSPRRFRTSSASSAREPTLRNAL